MSRTSHTTPPELKPVSVSLDDAGARHTLHPRTIRRAIAAGELPGYKVGSAVRVRVDELDAWMASKAIPNARTVRAGR